MPELPEVETIRRNLLAHKEHRIVTMELRRQDIVRRRDYEPQWLEGQTIQDFRRRGKFLIAALPQSRCLVFHLGMSGRCYSLAESGEQELPHVHFILHLDDRQKILYQDPRRFGGIWLCSDETAMFAAMGPEPLTPDFSAAYLAGVLSRRHTAVKNILLNQQLIAGLGNIYVDESLFAAGILPERRADTLEAEETARLYQAIVEVLQRGIDNRGTSFRDYRDGFNRPGDFQHYLKVYGKAGEACPVCGQPIQKITLGGRGTHYCAKCQH